MNELTGWDWLVLTAAFASTAFGLWRGAVKTVFGLAGWLLGILAAPLVGMLIGSQFQIGVAPMWVFYVAAFLLTFLGVRLVGFLLLKGVRSVGLAGVDRAFGAVLGLARAGMLVLVVAVIAHRLGFAQAPAWQSALSRPLLDIMVEVAQPWLPAPGQRVVKSS